MLLQICPETSSCLPDTPDARATSADSSRHLGTVELGSRFWHGIGCSVRTCHEGKNLFAMKLSLLLVALPSVLIAASAPSSVALSSAPNASVFGRPVTLVAVVAPSAASGSVTFYDASAVLGTTKLMSGQAVLTTTLLSTGSRSLKAYYGGDTNYAPSTSGTLVQTVNAVPGGGFQAPMTYGLGASAGPDGPFFVVVEDINGDGKADLAVANLEGSVSVL